MKLEDFQKELEVKFTDLSKQVDEKTAGGNEAVKQLAEFKSQFEEYKKTAVDAEKLIEMQKHLDKLDIKVNKKSPFAGTLSKKDFFSALDETLAKSKDQLKQMKSGSVDSLKIEVKAITDGDLDETTHNFTTGTYTDAVTDRRGLRESAFNPLWLRNYLPANTTDGSVIHYMKEDGWNGAVGVWDGTGSIDTLAGKPELSPKFDFVTDNVLWIAGITRVKREMLEDLSWLRGYLSRKLLTGKFGLYVAENTQILNVLTDAGNSTAYDGDNTNFLEAVYDAAFGQLVDNYHYPTTIFVNNRDMVNLIALNQASGSGEYDLPVGTVVVINGQMSIGGVPVVGTPQIDKGKFMVIAGNETEFITRMSPEIRFFDQDRDNVSKNLITVRIEERILPIVYDSTAIIYGEPAEVVGDGI